MINFYYHCYNESIDALVNKFCVQSLNYDIDSENDVILIHLILRINQDKGIYRKSELKESIWKLLSEKCIESIGSTSEYWVPDSRQSFCKLFDYCWMQKYSQRKDGKGAKPIYRIVYRNRPLKSKLIDNNILLILYLLSFVALCFFIDKWLIEERSYKWGGESIETHPIAFALCVLFIILVFIASTPGSEDTTIYGPALCCALLIISAIILALFEPNSMLFDNEYKRFELSESGITHLTLQFIKRNIYLGLACLLLIPIFKLNYRRLNEQSIL